MRAYIIRRLLIAIPTLFIVVTLVFLIVHIAPGDPATAALGNQASEQAVQELREQMGLNKPLWVQYITFLSKLVRGNLGRSLISGTPVTKTIIHVLPYTLVLTFTGVLIGIMIGAPLGVITAVYRNSFVDYFGRALSLFGLSVPAFYLGIVMMFIISVQFNLLPAVGAGNITQPLDYLTHLILPATSLGLLMTSYITRMLRSNLLNVLNNEYIQTARSKGLKERIVILKHAVRNAMLPTIAVIGIYSIVLMGGSVMVEEVFARPGLGRVLVEALKNSDYTTLQSTMVIYATLVVGINLLTDLSYGVINPQVRYG